MRYHNITKDDMKNGDGLRVVLWVAGCEHRCPGCHNPMTHDPDDGILFDEAAKQEIFVELEKPYVSGITFTGGDPLHPNNRTDIYVLADEIREKFPDKTIWLYTGYTWEHILQHMPVSTGTLLFDIDVLVDGPFIREKADSKLMWKGSSNQRVIDVKKSLEGNVDYKPVLYCGDYFHQETSAVSGNPPCCGC